MSKSLSMHAFCKLWWCECESERTGPNSAYVWEPLNTEAPADARPYCYGSGQVDFYDKTGNEKIDRLSHHNLQNLHATLLWLQEHKAWYSVSFGTCVYRNGRWHMRWLCYKNTRECEFANHGMRVWNQLWEPPWWPLRIHHWGGWHGWRSGTVIWRGRFVKEWGK